MMLSYLAARRASAGVLRLRSDVQAVTSIAYALIGIFMAVAILVAVTSLGTSLTSAFTRFATIV